MRLELSFKGRVRRDLRGIYRGSDRGSDRESPWLATQLCPTDARRFFPAFDEPALKLRYRIAVTVPADQTVISNAPVEFEEAAGRGRKTVHFEPTPPLSAYLVALAVGSFEASPTLYVGATPIRVYTLPGRQSLASFAREAAAESLGRLERWFEIPHPYPKLDLLALPDFAFGAMENAGAVFFRDSVLLLDAAQASPAELERTAETIAHELSHMWFGNLVTMAWWNDLWLNESFATWMAYEILDGWQPEWRVWHEFAHRREQALEQDALMTSHPIAPPIRDAKEAHENFDAITYTKGASVLRMLERFLGSEVFREGIQLYLRRHREGVATAADLWDALAEVSDQPIEKIIAPWTLQTGFPLVRVRRQDDGDHDRIALGQERFSGGRSRPIHAKASRRPALADSVGRKSRSRRRRQRPRDPPSLLENAGPVAGPGRRPHLDLRQRGGGRLLPRAARRIGVGGSARQPDEPLTPRTHRPHRQSVGPGPSGARAARVAPRPRREPRRRR